MKYDLVFEGGGAKGMVFVGACEEFFKRGHSFDRLLGTSAGAITATLMAAGYTPEEMLAALTEKEDGKPVFASFLGLPPKFTDEELRTGAIRRLLDSVDFKFVFDKWEKKFDDKLVRALAENEQSRHALALIERGGWFAADRFLAWLRQKLDSGTYKGNPRQFSALTLAQFFAATQVELSVVASDTTDAKLLVLNHHTAPDCPVVWVVRMSMSIPFLWNEVIWQPGWGQYLGRDLADHAIVDGGLLSNFPIELFISDTPEVVKLMGPKKANPVLGLLIDEQLPVVSPAAKGIFVDVNIKPEELRTLQRLHRLVNTATDAHDKMVIDEYSHLVVRLPAASYATTDFEMSDERRTALVAAGREAMARYLDGATLATKGMLSQPGSRQGTAADRIASSLLLGEREQRVATFTRSERLVISEEQTESPGEEGLRMPSAFNSSKLPLPEPPASPTLPPELKQAWVHYMANGFKQNEVMFQSTLAAFMKPYRLTIWLYMTLFAVGLGLFLSATVIGLRGGNSVVAVAFAGLSVGAFLAFFVRQPLHALEQNLEFITWLGVAFNTYWTRLLYMTEAKSVQPELKEAENDFRASVEKLIALHEELRGKRPSGE